MNRETHRTLTDERQREMMAKLIGWRQISQTDNTANMQRMVRANDFYNGDQWDLGLKEDLESQGKYCATIPLIRPQVMQLVGNVVANPKDIHVANVKGGIRVLADLQSTLLKHSVDECQGLDLTVQWFQRGSITGGGYIGWFRDYDRDPLHGNLVLKCLDEFDCMRDPTCRTYDLNGSPGTGADGSRFFIWDEWVDQGWADKRWPDKKDLFPSQPAGIGGTVYKPLTQQLYGVAGRDNERLSTRAEQTVPDYAKLRYKLTHTWWVEWRPCWYWYDNRRTELDAMVLIDRKEIRRARAVTERYPKVYRMVRSTAKVVNHTLSIGSIFLENYVDEFELAKANLAAIPVVGFHAFWDSRQHAGIVDDMIGPQETLNWLRSQVVNLLKLLPNTGWIIAKDIDNYSQTLKQHTGESAQVIDLSKCGGEITKIEPTTFPGGLDRLSDKAKGEIREVSNVRTENPEQDTQEQSGRAILAKQASSQTGVSPVLRNYDRSLITLGNIGINIIRCTDIYSDDEIRGIVEESSLIDAEMLHSARLAVCLALGIEFPQEPAIPNPVQFQPQPGQEPVSPLALQSMGQMYVREKQVYEALMGKIDEVARPMAIQALIDALRSPIAGRYNCTVILSPYSLTERLRRMASLAETNQLLVASGSPPLGEKYIIEASDLPNKDEVLKERGYG